MNYSIEPDAGNWIIRKMWKMIVAPGTTGCGNWHRRTAPVNAQKMLPETVNYPSPVLSIVMSRCSQSLLSVASERIVLFSTHIASDVAAAAQRILVLDHGRLLWDGPAEGILAHCHGRVVETVVTDDRLRELGRHELITTRVRTSEGVRIRVVLRPGGRLDGATVVAPNLEEAYLALINESGAESLAGTATAALLDDWVPR